MEHQASIDVSCPVHTVYAQWTQFEDFPIFMDHVERIDQIDDRQLEWHVKIFGVNRTWRAEITEQTPDQRIAWTSTDGTDNKGVVDFHALSDDTTRVLVLLKVDPEGFAEHVADWGGFVKDRLAKDLEQFKDFVENRGKPTGSWEGEIRRDPNRDSIRAALESMKKDELVDRAARAGITGRSNMTKDELIDALLRAA